MAFIPEPPKRPLSGPAVQYPRLVPFFHVIDITTAGTREPLMQGANQEIQLVKTITIKAFDANVGLVYLGLKDVSGTVARFNLAPGQSISYSAVDDPGYRRYIDIALFWVDTATSGNDICVTGLRELK